MATKQPDSVMARLMRLDEHPPDRQPFRKRGRVLSDSYIRKAASVGLRNGSSVSVKRLCDTLRRANGVPVVQMCNIKLEKCLSSTTSEVKSVDDSVARSLWGANYEDRKAFREKDKHHARRHVLRFLQKIECDSLEGDLDESSVDHKNKFLKIQSEAVDKRCISTDGIIVCEPKSVKLANNEDLKFDSRPEIGKFHHGLAYRKLVFKNAVSPRCSSIARERTMHRIPRQERQSNFSDVCRSGYMNESYSVNEPWAPIPSFPGPHDYKIYNHSCLSNKSSLASEAKKRNIERRKMAKDIEKPRFFGRSQTFDEMLVLASGKSVPRNLNLKLSGNGYNFREDGLTWRDRSKKQNISHKNILESLYWRGHEQFQFTAGVNGTIRSSKVSESSETSDAVPKAGIQAIQEEIYDMCVKVEPAQTVSKLSVNGPPSQNAIRDALVNAEAFGVGSHYSESNLASFAMEDGHFSHVQEVGEATLKGYSDEESPYSSSSRIGASEFQDYSKGANHRSPDSVLEPVDSPNPSPSECFKNMDLLLQLQDMNFESEETYSEGSVMVVSGDNDSEEGFSDLSAENRKVRRWLGYHESRSFSYLVDVLNEAGLCSTKSFTDIKTWNSPEYPMRPLVFETLEKKYGKQTSWEKSERRLLFDRIISGLMKIVSPVVNFHDHSKSMRKQFSSAWRRDEIEDELWMMLMREEEEMSIALNEKVLGRGMKWLELEEDISFICRELETSLFDEVVMELASLWD